MNDTATALYKAAAAALKKAQEDGYVTAELVALQVHVHRFKDERVAWLRRLGFPATADALERMEELK